MDISKQFKVATVSQNTNSFGLRGFILVAKDGQAFEAAANYLNVPNKGDIITLPGTTDGTRTRFNFAKKSYEIPHPLSQAPSDVVKEIWEEKSAVK